MGLHSPRIHFQFVSLQGWDEKQFLLLLLDLISSFRLAYVKCCERADSHLQQFTHSQSDTCGDRLPCRASWMTCGHTAWENVAVPWPGSSGAGSRNM